MATVFMSYCHADEPMRDRLEKHLTMLKRERLIEVWHDRRIVPGQPLDPTIMAQIEEADVFLFLLSVDFIASHYCYEVEMTRALERQAAGQAEVVPIVLHSCEWLKTPLGKFAGTPWEGKPIAKAPYPEDAYLEVAQAIRRVIAARMPTPRANAGTTNPPAATRGRSGGNAASDQGARGMQAQSSHPRSSNLAIRKTFADSDRHAFLEDGFEFIARFFEESLAELGRRNPGVEARFRRNGADVFTARAFRGGNQEAQCRVQLSGGFGSGKKISFSYDANSHPSSSNETLSVRSDDQALMFDALGMANMSGREAKAMSAQGAAEYLWGLFIKSMQSERHR